LGINQTEGFYVQWQKFRCWKTGLKKGDIIVKWMVKIATYADLSGYQYQKRPNDKIQVTYTRNGKQRRPCSFKWILKYWI
jgi:type II secretory pathway component PulC